MTDAELEAIALKATPDGEPGDWYVVEQPWLPPNCEPYIIAGNPDPHAGRYVCDFVEVEIAGHEDEYSDEEWSARNWALAEYIAAANPKAILSLLARVRALQADRDEEYAQDAAFAQDSIDMIAPLRKHIPECDVWRFDELILRLRLDVVRPDCIAIAREDFAEEEAIRQQGGAGT